MNLLRVFLIVQLMLAALLPVGTASADALITDYPTPYGGFNMVAGPDGAMWFDSQYDHINRIDNTGTVSSYTIPPPAGSSYPSSVLRGITLGPDGNFWVTLGPQNNVAKVTPTGGVTEYQLPYLPLSYPSTYPEDITTGPDGALWFTENNGDAIGRITTDGSLSTYQLSSPQSYPERITLGPDGALWFTESNGDRIGRITTDGSITEYSLPTSTNARSPYGITAGSDGALWFTESNGGKIGRITTSGIITEYTIPTANSIPEGITSADGSLWFAEYASNQIGRITTSGVVTEYPVPTAGSGPLEIAAASDGSLWYANDSNNRVGHVIPQVRSTSLSLMPNSGTSIVNGTASFTAVATNSSNQPAAGITVRYSVSGSVTMTGNCVTDSTGSCSFSYSGPQFAGADLIDVYADNNNNNQQDQGEPTANATMAWDLPANSTTSGSVHGHGKLTANNGHKFNVGFHATNKNGVVSGTCNIVDQTTNSVYDCTNANVLVENSATGRATIFGDITINGQATTYRMDVVDNSATSQPDTFSFVTQGGYSVVGGLDSNAKVTVQ